MKLKVGDRVTADVGAGPQAGKIVGRWALGYMVLFDVAPPREYNMGENPTAMLPYWCDEHSGFHLGLPSSPSAPRQEPMRRQVVSETTLSAEDQLAVEEVRD